MAQASQSTTTDSLSSLPFIRPRAVDDLSKQDFWSVEPTGDPDLDSKVGHHLAKRAIAYMRAHDFSPLLGWIIADMMRKGSLGRIELGFLAGVASTSMSAPRLN